MHEKKISLPEVEKMLRDGIHQSAIARQLQVSKQAISKCILRMKRQNEQAALSVNPAVVKAVLSSKIDGMEQLKKINEVVSGEIRLLNKRIKDALGEERENLVLQRLRHVAEIRKQLNLLLDICKELYNAEEVQHFQQTVLDAINEVDENVKNEIIRRLRTLRSARSVFGSG